MSRGVHHRLDGRIRDGGFGSLSRRTARMPAGKTGFFVIDACYIALKLIRRG